MTTVAEAIEELNSAFDELYRGYDPYNSADTNYWRWLWVLAGKAIPYA